MVGPNHTGQSNYVDLATNEDVVRGFIMGMSRSGTHWMAESLNTHPAVVVIGETAFWGRKHVEPSESGTYSRDDLERVRRRYRSGCTSTPASQRLVGKDGVVSRLIDKIVDENRQVAPPEMFVAICTEMAALEGKNYVVEKTPHHINWVDRIAIEFPSAKFIVMMRDPYDFMLSYKHQCDRKEASVRDTYNKLYHPIGCSIVYRRYINSIWKALEKHSQRCHVVNYGDLKADSDQELLKVQQFLGIPALDIALPRVNSSFPSGRRPELSPEDVLWMNIIAGTEIRRAGFPVRSVDKSELGHLKSVLRIPVWAYHCTTHLSQRTGERFVPYVRKWIFG